MKLKLDFDFPPLSNTIKHGDKVVLLGSCFSDSMSPYFSNAGFEVLSNPFGTLFHPISIANTIIASLNNSEEVNVIQRDDVFFSWDSGSKIFAYSEKELIARVISERQKLKQALVDAKMLVVTLGTAWGYRNKELNTIVGNCHKQPGAEFEKELSSSKDLEEVWSEALKCIRAVNFDLEIVYTVSPVRHVKDGLVENNISKGRLIEFCQSNLSLSVAYFPSYEIVIDELRDYRFYTSDLVHPNQEAVNYVWERFKSFAFSQSTTDLIDEISKVQALINHRSLHPESKADIARVEKGKELKEELKRQHPKVYWK